MHYMEKLIEKSIKKTNAVKLKFQRYLYDDIDWNYRLIGVKGARGVGKTTLLLQRLKVIDSSPVKSLYVSLDDIYFSANNLVDLAGSFVKLGGENLFLDEVHKYDNWSQEIKNIYDDYPELNVVFTSSSALEIHKGSHDLSRRAMVYNLNELSLREYTNFTYKLNLEPVTLTDILTNHTEISNNVIQNIKPIAIFNEYIKYGAYPFIAEGKSNYYERIETIINLIIENDLQSIENISYSTVIKIKKLLYVIAEIVPFKPNISDLSRKLDTTRDLLLKYLHYLERANILLMLRTHTKGISQMAKPEKIYLNNTTLMYALNPQKVNIGTVRGTFFLNQLSCKHQVTYPQKGDFIVDNKFVFEIGGKNKSREQIKGILNSFVVLDNIEYGMGNKIPLWQFGFLY